ncbi:hypothetical protein CHR29_13835 [Pseudomonas monteilii]|uniref:Uncharacterized protein n=1 Tax=Pseudomonas monteilii TaxID=76759 RepID=A0AAP7FRF7_9PSED|nr:hypothetical protein CHR29_13835 [Pseudomonas monteilii]OAH56442.1 hypothetical protein AYJ70_08810 [Pseudomonas monteilii]
MDNGQEYACTPAGSEHIAMNLSLQLEMLDERGYALIPGVLEPLTRSTTAALRTARPILKKRISQ